MEQIEKDCEARGYKMLGWQIGLENPERKLCFEAGHKPKDKQHNPRGSNCTFWCDDCRIYWKIDMSD